MKNTPTTPYLLTPGPLTTTPETRAAMDRDWGSRDHDFIALTQRVRDKLLDIAGKPPGYSAVPLQGSGTFAVEAMIGTFVPKDGKLLVLINGAYGRRMVAIAKQIGRTVEKLECLETEPMDVDALDRLLASDKAITHVAAVHLETTTGILNPLTEIAATTRKHGRALLVDSMSAFGALPVDTSSLDFEALAASSNKCIEGVPGLGFVIAKDTSLQNAAGNAHSLSLDLAAQWAGFNKNGQWRFTPPTHVLAAFDKALDGLRAEGGPTARLKRYQNNHDVLVGGMRAMGFETLLSDNLRSPVIVTFKEPTDPKYNFNEFYDAVHRRGFALYPGKVTEAESFRIGCIGALGEAEMLGALDAIKDAMAELGINITKQGQG